MHVADVATVVAETGAESVTVVGHSFGGVLGAVLASEVFGLPVRGVLAVGVKLDWTDDEIAAATGSRSGTAEVRGSAGPARPRRPAGAAGRRRGAGRVRRGGRPEDLLRRGRRRPRADGTVPRPCASPRGRPTPGRRSTRCAPSTRPRR
ncbi:alpha/beta fold hydrolase [Pseudonocardia dioxanivorans]|uniref:alpha/beta fold hydrolase n=1 Tax=Pseudonocardia dioxanivorans TaxID=240495 RepID=UPI001043CBCF